MMIYLGPTEDYNETLPIIFGLSKHILHSQHVLFRCTVYTVNQGWVNSKILENQKQSKYQKNQYPKIQNFPENPYLSQKYLLSPKIYNVSVSEIFRKSDSFFSLSKIHFFPENPISLLVMALHHSGQMSQRSKVSRSLFEDVIGIVIVIALGKDREIVEQKLKP